MEPLVELNGRVWLHELCERARMQGSGREPQEVPVEMNGKDRLIVALDVPTHDRAFALVDQLDNVSFFKVGLELWLAGDIFGFLRGLQERRALTGGVFVDLKLAGDIGNTITSLIRTFQSLNVKFITLVETVPLAMTLATVEVARRARGSADIPRLLMVPFLSSLDVDDLRAGGVRGDLNTYIAERSRNMLGAGCDGLIVSGDAIKTCRDAFGPAVALVSPGIRPSWASSDDHKRFTTPSAAIKFGADYLVVGRPITNDRNPRQAAQRIIDEVDEALSEPEHEAQATHGHVAVR